MMTSFFQYTPNAPPDHPVVNSLAERLRNLSPDAMEAARLFPMRLPRALAKQIPWEHPNHPMAKEFFPDDAELAHPPGYSTDPLHEQNLEVIPGLIHKYSGRVLLRVTTNCAVHCRFCFRRHAPRENIPVTFREWTPALTMIAQDVSLREVIFSGGDPLTLTDRRLSLLAHRLAEIPHLERLRIHTRMVVMVPERITHAFLNWLTATRLTPIVVIHVNHAEELNQAALAAVERLTKAGIPLLNQSVLLKGINDTPETLVTLCETLVNAKIIPYYLHMLDPVLGAAHFHVEESIALNLMEELRSRLPGYAVPRLVRDTPGAASKQMLW
ncbi:MAG: EF-P beta-lysylation protein EpmB [Magnetococcus sp. YQC-5]